VIRFTVYGQPAPAGSKTPGRAKDGRLFVRDSSGQRGTEWRRQVAQVAGETMAGGELVEGPLVLQLVFHVPRPKGHYGKRGLRPSAPAHPTTKPDVTKLVRAVEDALTGIVWRDDAQVVKQVACKKYGEPARCSVTVWQHEPSVTAPPKRHLDV
jgi:Holliday junction resolvase RusA-like endonuclease